MSIASAASKAASAAKTVNSAVNPLSAAAALGCGGVGARVLLSGDLGGKAGKAIVAADLLPDLLGC